MKFIKASIAIMICLCATATLHAQQSKAESAKREEIPAQAERNKAATPQPGLKQQPKVATVATKAPAETPSPSNRKDDTKPDEQIKMELKALIAQPLVTPGGEEGRKILEGRGEGQRSSGPTTPNTIDPNPKLIPAAKSKATQQQN